MIASGETSKLSELNIFLTEMPKGGDLHNHYSGSIYAETYLDWIAKYNACIYKDDDLSLNIQKFRIETRVGSLSEAAKIICISADKVRADNNFYRQLLKRWSDIDYSNHYHEQPPPDQQFFDTFGYFGPASDFAYGEGLKWIKTTAMNENVQYIELMLKGGVDLPVSSQLNQMVNGLTSQTVDTEIDRVLITYFESVVNNITINETINKYVQFMEKTVEGINDGNFTLRFQTYVTRGNTPARVFSGLISSFFAVLRSDVVVGVNIVGPENGIVAMRDYTLHMKMFRFLKQRYPDVKLAMHAGELVIGLVPPESLQFHIRQAIEIAGANRIGHGIDIFYEHDAYDLLKLMKDRQIAVEAVISSNAFILGVKNEAHPLLVYKAHGVPLIIATDDAGVSRSTMSNEYLMFSDRYKPNYQELKSLAYNSIRHSFLSQKDKDEQIQILDERFLKFESKIADVAKSLGDPGVVPLNNGSFKITSTIFIFFAFVFSLILKN